MSILVTCNSNKILWGAKEKERYFERINHIKIEKKNVIHLCVYTYTFMNIVESEHQALCCGCMQV